jgi:hypothetical protein
MLFLVLGENIDSGYLTPPEQVIPVIETAVLGSFQMAAQWEQEGRIKGGTFPGERAGGFVIEAASFEELDSLMNSLPFFGLVKWQVKPLLSFSTTVQQLQQNVARLKEMTSQGGPQ